MTHGVNIPHSCRVVRDLILSRINQGRFDAHLANGIIRGNPFSELNRLLSDGIWVFTPTCPKEITKVRTIIETTKLIEEKTSEAQS